MLLSIISCILPLWKLLRRVSTFRAIALILSFILNSFTSYKDVKKGISSFSQLHPRKNSSLSYVESISLSTYVIGAVSMIIPEYSLLLDSFIYFDVLIGIWSCCKEFSNSLLRRLSVLSFPLFLLCTSPLNDYFIAILLTGFVSEILLYHALSHLHFYFSISEMILLSKYFLLFSYLLITSSSISLQISSVIILKSCFLTCLVLYLIQHFPSISSSPYWILSLIFAGAAIEISSLSFLLQQAFIPWFCQWIFEIAPSSFSLHRLFYLFYWFSLLFLFFYSMNRGYCQNNKQIIQRKYFHLLAVVLFTPVTLLDPSFIQISFSIAFLGFLLMEILCKSILPLLQTFLTSFTDSRDNGPLILTHFSLLLGCATPVWLLQDSIEEKALIGRLAGICSIGIGDSFAAIVGTNWGRITLYQHKTVEGFIGFFSSSVVFYWCICKITQISFSWKICISIVACAMEEVVCEEIDNYVLPFYFLSLLLL